MLELADDASGQKTGDMEAFLVLRHSCGTSCARGGGATSSSDSLKYPRLALKENNAPSEASEPRWLARIFSELRSFLRVVSGSSSRAEMFCRNRAKEPGSAADGKRTQEWPIDAYVDGRSQ